MFGEVSIKLIPCENCGADREQEEVDMGSVCGNCGYDVNNDRIIGDGRPCARLMEELRSADKSDGLS